jgi:DNA-binding MarR family transcriptional regulator
VNWQLLARANTHPLRISILEVLSLDDGRTLSPKDLSLELQSPLSTINYHVTELAKAGLLEMVDQQQVRGAVEHFYRPISETPRSAARRANRNGASRRNGHCGKRPAGRQSPAGRRVGAA